MLWYVWEISWRLRNLDAKPSSNFSHKCYCWFLIIDTTSAYVHPKISFRALASVVKQIRRDGVSNHQPHDCFLNRFVRHTWKKISKLRVTGLCEGNSPVTGEFPAQRVSNAQMFPFDDVIMRFLMIDTTSTNVHASKICFRAFASGMKQLHGFYWVNSKRNSSMAKYDIQTVVRIIYVISLPDKQMRNL